ncbi:hypothetical protein D3C73_620500 [compost metagenome]
MGSMNRSAREYDQVWYVSPEGNDVNDGTKEQPFKTLGRARDAVRELNQSMQGDIVIYLRGGMYALKETLVLDERDSGFNGFQVIYCAYPGEKPILSGGQVLGEWRKSGNLIYSCSVGELRFRQLYINGQRANRARSPVRGQYNRIKAWDKESKEIILDRHEVKDWSQFQGVEMVIQQFWSESTVRLKQFRISGQEARVTIQEPEGTMLFQRPHAPKVPGQYYHFENALEFVQEQGDWYANNATGELSYIPHEDVDMTSVIAIAPVVETLISLVGTLNHPVHDILISGLTFEHTTWLRPSEQGNLNAQAGQYNVYADEHNKQYVGRPSAGVYVACAQRVCIHRNEFRHMGATALDFHYGTDTCEAEGNLIHDIAGNGISIGIYSKPDVNFTEPYNPADLREVATGDKIRNNVIRRVGLDYYGAVGIGAGYVRSIRIEHNDLEDLPYSGISMGWGWLHADTAARDNHIVCNRIRRAMSLLCDGGGIYTLSKQPDSEISGNLIIDIKRSPWADRYPIAAIYLDEGTAGFRVFGNEHRYSTPEDIHLHHTGENIISNYNSDVEAVTAFAGLETDYRDLLDSIGVSNDR